MKKIRAIALKARVIKALTEEAKSREQLRNLCSDPENMERVIYLMIAQGIAIEKKGLINVQTL